VTVGTYHRMYVRLYRGAAGSDFAEGTNGVYSKGVTLTSYIISAPPNFPRSKQKCYPSTDSSDPQDLVRRRSFCFSVDLSHWLGANTLRKSPSDSVV